VAYKPNGEYIFRFFDQGSTTEVTLFGPYERDPSLPRWSTLTEHRSGDAPVALVLDLSTLEHSFEEVREAAAHASQSSPERLGISVQRNPDGLIWEIKGVSAAGVVINCMAADSDLSRISCEQP
jgi:hypothetical protein